MFVRRKKTMEHTMLLKIFSQIVTCVIWVVAQKEIAFQSVEQNARIDGVAPFYNRTTHSLTECYLTCLQHLEKCSFVEVASINEASWSCKLFHFDTMTQTMDVIKTHLRLSKGSEISTPTVSRDCMQLRVLGFRKDGVYFIRQGSFAKKVFCDMTTEGGGWIVMQKRFDGSVDFNRDWNNYKDGFGDVNAGEYWLGNEFVHQYTKANPAEMIVEGTAFDGVRIAIKIKNFKLGDESSNYVLGYDACVSLTTDKQNAKGCSDWAHSQNANFTTQDNDNDGCKNNCAVLSTGGWWYGSYCFIITPNSKYSPVRVANITGIYWYSFRGLYESLKTTRMLIRQIPP